MAISIYRFELEMCDKPKKCYTKRFISIESADYCTCHSSSTSAHSELVTKKANNLLNGKYVGRRGRCISNVLYIDFNLISVAFFLHFNFFISLSPSHSFYPIKCFRSVSLELEFMSLISGPSVLLKCILTMYIICGHIFVVCDSCRSFLFVQSNSCVFTANMPRYQ